MSNPLSTELRLRTEAGDEAQLQNLPAPVMQALYHQITGRTEKLIRDYDDHYIIRAGDIKNIIDKLGQTLQQFNYKATSTALTVFHHQREKMVFSSLEKFLQYDSTKGDPTAEITIDIGLLISVPHVGTHQNYKISIEIASYILLDETRNPKVGIGSRYDGSQDPCIKLTIDYVDYVVARSFLSTVEEWERSLDRTTLFVLPDWYQRNQWHVDRTFTAFATAGSIWGATSVVSSLQGDVVFRGGLVAIAAILAALVFSTIIEVAHEYINVHRHFPYIIINKADGRNYEAFMQRRALANRIGFAIFGSGIIVLIANVFAKYISKWLGLM
jgi:hypothetical protein